MVVEEVEEVEEEKMELLGQSRRKVPPRSPPSH